MRINDTLYAAAREKLEDITRAHGYEGRLVVLGEPSVAVGDCRIEWADGGIDRDAGLADGAIAGRSLVISARGAASPRQREMTRRSENE